MTDYGSPTDPAPRLQSRWLCCETVGAGAPQLKGRTTRFDLSVNYLMTSQLFQRMRPTLLVNQISVAVDSMAILSMASINTQSQYYSWQRVISVFATSSELGDSNILG